MKTVFNPQIREELISRIGSLDEGSTAAWGKMNIYQMLKHCTLCDEMLLGKKKYKRAFIGRIFGKMGLRRMLKDDSPMPKNSPTGNEFRIKQTTGNVEAEKMKWISLVKEYENYTPAEFTHWFFGKMTREQVGNFAYKHSDHHLRQFNC